MSRIVHSRSNGPGTRKRGLCLLKSTEPPPTPRQRPEGATAPNRDTATTRTGPAADRTRGGHPTGDNPDRGQNSGPRTPTRPGTDDTSAAETRRDGTRETSADNRDGPRTPGDNADARTRHTTRQTRPRTQNQTQHTSRRQNGKRTTRRTGNNPPPPALAHPHCQGRAYSRACCSLDSAGIMRVVWGGGKYSAGLSHCYS